MRNSKKRKIGLKNRQKFSFQRKISLLIRRAIFALKILLLIMLILLSFTNYFDTYTKLIREKFYAQTVDYGFSVQHIIHRGEKNTSEAEIRQALRAKIGDAILAIDLATVKKRLEQTIWVEKAVIERRLPTTIYIEITEKTPIAIWQFQKELYLIDQQGEKITKYQDVNFADLLHVVGEDANIYAHHLLTILNTYPALVEKIRSAVRYGNRRWDLNLEQNIVVKMPAKNFARAYQYLQDLDQKQELFDRGYKSLDLRDSEKYYLE